MSRVGKTSGKENAVVVRMLWVVAAAVTVTIAVVQFFPFRNVAPSSPIGEGADFWAFLHAADQIAKGRSPYGLSTIHQGHGYIYSPFVALVLLPVRHFSIKWLWRSWTALSIAALIITGGLITLDAAQRLRPWHRPVFFCFTALTASVFVPSKWDLYDGQTDAFVLLALVASTLVALRGSRFTQGALIGLGAVIKSWPGASGLILLRRDSPKRARALIGFFSAALVAPLLALAVGGGSGLSHFIRVTVDAGSQQNPSYSVWGAPGILFSFSGYARPLFVSTPLRDTLSISLGIFVLGLLAIILRSHRESEVSFWNVLGCVILVLPVSHIDYCLYFLPLLWLWTQRALTAKPFNRWRFLMAAVMLGWWLVLFHWDWVQFPEGSSLHFVIPFFANFVAVTCSVLADHSRITDDQRVSSISTQQLLDRSSQREINATGDW